MTDRQYALTRVSRGDYLFPSNDARTLWRVYTYEEDGSAQRGDGSIIIGTFWACARRPMPSPDDLLNLESWDEWEFWAGPLPTRADAIEQALRA